jgi:hypothetical protein
VFTTDAAEDDGITFQMAGESFGFSTSQTATYFGCRLKAGEATQNDWMVGLNITDTTQLGGITDGVYFEKLDGGTGISFTTEKNSTETQTDNLATFAADTYVVLEFYFDGTSVKAMINGTVVATHTTNICDDELLTPTLEILTGEARRSHADARLVARHPDRSLTRWRTRSRRRPRRRLAAPLGLRQVSRA